MLQPILDNLQSDAEIYDKRSKEAVDNISSIIKRVTDHNITNDLSFFVMIKNNAKQFGANATLLESACKLSDIARQGIESYKADVTRLVRDLKGKLIPDMSQLNEELDDIVQHLNFTIPEEVEIGKKKLTQLDSEIRAASLHTETSMQTLLNEFADHIIASASTVVDVFTDLINKLRKLLQLPDSSEHGLEIPV